MPFAVEFAVRLRSLTSLPAPPVGEESVLSPWEPLAHAVEDALARGETHYTDRPGILPLRQQVTALLRERFSVTADPRSMSVITCSVIEARFVALQQLLAAGDNVWAPEPLVDRIAGAALIRRAILADNPNAARLVYLASSLGEDRLRTLLPTLPAEALIVFEVDRAAGSFHPAQLAAYADRTITIGSLGYASWQLGYLVSPATLAAGLRDFKQALTICSTNLSQWAALAAMESR